MSSDRPNRFDRDPDPADDPDYVNSEVRDAIQKELKRTDLSAEDRKAYEEALAKLEKGGSSPSS
jgi:hypothetical protein